jgi:hypothetical protein
MMLLLTSGITLAGPTRIAPFLEFKQEYSDNINFSSDNKESDFISTLTGGLKIEQKTERLNTGIKGELGRMEYDELSDLDALDYTLSGNIAYMFTERFNSRVSARYSKDSRSDRDADTTGLIVNGDRKTGGLSLGSGYQFSELRHGALSLNISRSETDGGSTIEENDSIGGNVSISQNLSEFYENTSGSLNISYNHYSTDSKDSIRGTIEDTSSDAIQMTAGLSKNITELYHVYFNAGGSYSKTKEQVRTNNTAGPEYDDDSWGGVFSAGIGYKDEYYDASLSIDQGMEPGIGTSGLLQRSSVSGSIGRKVTDRFSLTLDASCFLNQNERQNSADTEELTFNIQPGMSFNLGRDFILSCIYRFSSVENRVDSTNREQNLVYIKLRKEWNLLE